MEHYVETGQVLGKATHGLEGYTLHPELTGLYTHGYFGPGELPTFNAQFFDIPKGSRENSALDELIKEMSIQDTSKERPENDKVLFEFRDRLREIIKGDAISDSTMF